MSSPIVTETRDPNTCETIKSCEIPEVLFKEIDKVLGVHQGMNNQFVGMAHGLADMVLKLMETKKNIKESDDTVRKKLQFVCKKLNLDASEPWTYNMQSKRFEVRVPPEIAPLKPITASQLSPVPPK